MSQETVLKFFESIRSNEAITEQLRALSTDVDAFARAAVEAGRKQGFAFDASDVTAALAALTKQNAGELSEGELAAVAGGTGSIVTPGCMQTAYCGTTTLFGMRRLTLGCMPQGGSTKAC